MISNVEKEGWHYLAVKKVCIITWSNCKKGLLQQKTNLSLLKKYVKIKISKSLEGLYEKFSTFSREHASNVINFEIEKMESLTKKELKLHQDATECYICRKRFLKKVC